MLGTKLTYYKLNFIWSICASLLSVGLTPLIVFSETFTDARHRLPHLTLAKRGLGFWFLIVDPNLVYLQQVLLRRDSVWTDKKYIFCFIGQCSSHLSKYRIGILCCIPVFLIKFNVYVQLFYTVTTVITFTVFKWLHQSDDLDAMCHFFYYFLQSHGLVFSIFLRLKNESIDQTV